MSPDDPRCPECGESVSATASYCLQCEADLDGGDDGTVEAAVVDFDGSAGWSEAVAEGTAEGTARATAGKQPPDAGGAAGADHDSRQARSGPAAGGAHPDEATDERGWFHPDSLLDDLSTGVVGVVAGLVFGFLLMVPLVAWTDSAVGFLAWPVGLVGAGLYVGWTRSVFGAVRKACYVLAPTLAVMPLFWFGPALEGGDLGGRVFAFVVSEVVALPIALALVGLGYWVGGKRPD